MSFQNPMPGRVSLLDLQNPRHPYTRWLSERRAQVCGALHGVQLYLIALSEDELSRLKHGEFNQACWLLGAYVVQGYHDVYVSNPEAFGWTRDA